MTTDCFRAVIMDMDGVVTDTAAVHSRAWKELFDDFLTGRDPHARLFSDDDYRHYVDGRIRIDGVATFLASRNIELPLGTAQDDPSAGTMWGLANRKNSFFRVAIDEVGVTAFPATIALLTRLRAMGIGTALVSASRNAELVLGIAGIARLFDERVDGVTAAELGLPGKPQPDTFLEAARRLGAHPGTCVVVEDALSGVEAARRGGFGLVVGVDRHGQADAFRQAGADIVVADIGELADDRIFSSDPWILAYRGFDPAAEGTREALLTVGNGYLGTRGAMSHTRAGDVHYPGTYAAGVYNRLHSDVDGHEREDESMVNLPNWLPLSFRVGGGEWLSAHHGFLADHRVALDLRDATLTRTATIVDDAGRRTRLIERRLTSMDNPHLAAVEWRLVPENWQGALELRSVLDGDVANTNVAAHRQLNNRHLEVIERTATGSTCVLVARTTQSQISIAMAARTSVRHGGDDVPPAAILQDHPGRIGLSFALEVHRDDEVVIEKVLGVANSRDRAITEPAVAATVTVSEAPSFDLIHVDHAQRWADLWRRFHVELDNGDDDRLAVRVHQLHVCQTLSPHTMDLDAGVPARGLHGEAYRGHVFWDELFALPLLDLRLPELARSLLLYRWRRLPEARRRAAALGCRGALFAWQSGSDGREETEQELYNPLSDSWMADNSALQYHINLAIAHNAWQHWQVTADLGYLAGYGAELLIESARFFADLATYDPEDDRYDLCGVMGPDEFHDGYPGRPGRGIDNNTYVNVMASWALARAGQALDILGPELGDDLCSRLDLDPGETEAWDRVSRGLRVEFLANGLPAQFSGYGALAPFDWDRYRERYGNIGRLDLILQAEGDNTNNYQLSKQADLIMLFYLFSAEELTALFKQMGYPFDPATIPATIDYYEAHTSHGSTLSRVVHSWVLARADRARSWRLFQETLDADLADTQGGTTREGIHLGAMAGSLDLLQRCYSGVDPRDDTLWFNPLLPKEATSIEFRLRYRNQAIEVRIDHRQLEIIAAPGPADPITVGFVDRRKKLGAGERLRFDITARPQRQPARNVP